ncbi:MULTISPECIES: aminotransferase class V-fold PLP-dependent enzyme [unclassified Halomonas]|uniref:aminotransferase class V-fold PLP-dependent enzyme n=1 Tax=unclassified Halomonas TaxID=2609666 RepID=UPI002076A094|nr:MULTISPECIES: aminotransferase class V-fold PLP-dependent enzyme [unclassified Halomonas]
MTTLADDVIGEGESIAGPFGPRPLLYADYTASGRALGTVERAMREQVLPYYANTHTETSYTGRITTRLREDARRQIANAVSATDDYAVIFAGAGATAAIDRCWKMLGLARFDQTSDEARPVVFLGPYEHHSNDLAWRECDAEITRVPLDAAGLIDLDALEKALLRFPGRRLIGAFSAASNVTGVKSDVAAIARLMHAHGGIALFDYAASGPYVPINVAGTGRGDHLDGVFVSPHKFVGGPGSSGVLIVRRALCVNTVPSVAGGGTVSYVTAKGHRYVSDIQRREEGGTPNILGDIRAGFAFRIKSLIGEERIETREAELAKRALERWSRIDNLTLLGPSDAPRLSIFSFNVRAGEREVHHNLIVALLNDLFGIQARGGCSCAGPYGHSLLNIDADTAFEHESLVQNGRSLYRPGWVRLGFHFFFSNETANYVISAVEFIARHAALLMKLYSVDERSGTWTVRDGVYPTPSIDTAAKTLDALLEPASARKALADESDPFAEAEHLVELAKRAAPPADPHGFDTPIRWFWWPHEAEDAVHSQDKMTP